MHWYTDEGLEESEFKQAEDNVRNLISEYERIQEFKDTAVDDQEAEDRDPDDDEIEQV